MNKKTIEIIITSILAVVLIFTFTRSLKLFMKARHSNAPVAQVSEPQKNEPVRAEYPQISQMADQMKNIYPNLLEDESLEWGRCPFSGKKFGEVVETPVITGPKPILLNLGGIIWDTTNPKALINDEIVQPGYMIGQYTVKEIKQDRVIINDGDKDIVLTLQ